tara:strand:+ start:788 stop:1006 length:219 start_codon:yes stop_codon:yes gene_type:complete
MKLIQFEQISREDIEKEAFDIATNNGRAHLLQDLLKGADNLNSNLDHNEGIIFMKQVDGNVIKFEVVEQKAS